MGTTFSLDLQALLLAPLAFAFFESGATEDEEASGPDPVALLAALREASERLHIFCQAGRIAVPRQYRRVLALVEDAVHAVLGTDARSHLPPQGVGTSVHRRT